MLALERAGIKVANYYASEIDKYAMAVSKANYPNIIQLGDVTQVNWFGLPKIDLLIGGSPCQGFSFAGKQLNFDDPRSKLFFEFVRILKEVQPKYWLLENVKMKKEYQDIISQHLGVEPIEINSALVSAQNRRRLYWTNIPGIEQPEDRGIVLRDIIDTKLENVQLNRYDGILKIGNVNPSGKGMNGNVFSISGKSPCLTTNKGEGIKITGGAIRGRYIVDGKRADNKVSSMTGLTEQRIETRPDEKSNCLTTVEKDNILIIQTTRGIKNNKICVQVGNAGISNWRRDDAVYSINAKNPTLMANSGGKKTPKIAVDDIFWRKLTPEECEALQTIPREYTNHVSNSQRYKMLGNGWTIDVIAHIFSYTDFARVSRRVLCAASCDLLGMLIY